MLRTIVGKRRRGKTTLAQHLVFESKADRIFIIDFMREFVVFRSPRCFVCLDYTRVDDFCAYVWENSSPRFQSLVVFDEIDRYGKDNKAIEYLYCYGGHKNIDIMAIARRFYKLPVSARSETDRFYCFQVTEWNDLRAVRSEISPEYAEILPRLNFYEYIIIDL